MAEVKLLVGATCKVEMKRLSEGRHYRQAHRHYGEIYVVDL